VNQTNEIRRYQVTVLTRNDKMILILFKHLLFTYTNVLQMRYVTTPETSAKRFKL